MFILINRFSNLSQHTCGSLVAHSCSENHCIRKWGEVLHQHLKVDRMHQSKRSWGENSKGPPTKKFCLWSPSFQEKQEGKTYILLQAIIVEHSLVVSKVKMKILGDLNMDIHCLLWYSFSPHRGQFWDISTRPLRRSVYLYTSMHKYIRNRNMWTVKQRGLNRVILCYSGYCEHNSRQQGAQCQLRYSLYTGLISPRHQCPQALHGKGILMPNWSVSLQYTNKQVQRPTIDKWIFQGKSSI